MFLIGLDIGTTGCKAILFDETGAILASASREYAVDMPHPGWAEQDGEVVWKLAQECLQTVATSSTVREVVAIGLSVQGEAIAPSDENGRLLRPMILGMDTRTAEQNRWLDEKIGAQNLFERTGMPLHTINTLPKLLWLKQNEPELWKVAARFLLYEDFLIQKMTGHPAISRCLASRTQLYDLRQGDWSEEILQAIGLESSRLTPVSPSGVAVERMSAGLAKGLGFTNRPFIVTGVHDQACGALGVGLTTPGLAMVSTGTAEVVEVALASPTLNQELYRGNLSCYEHVVPELYLAMTLNHSGGLLLRWFRDTFCETEREQAQAARLDPYDLILRHASADPTSLLVLPHFAGSGTPTFDTSSKGAILGLTFTTNKTDLAKALLEGLTFELRLNLEVLQRGGVVIDELRAIGGGARSMQWLQLKADVTGIRVTRPRLTEAAAWGAALLAGHGAGFFPDLKLAANQRLHIERSFTPDPGRLRKYNDRYALYQQIYPAVSAIHHQM